MDLNYRQLRALLAIAAKGSVSGAAMEMSMTQPALSRLLNQAERRYGVDLFHRQGRGGVQLTEAGRRFADHAAEIVRHFDLIRDDLQQLRGKLAGKVGVAMPESAGHTLFVPLIKRFKERHPQVDLRVMSVSSVDIPHHLLSGNADVGVVTHSDDLPGLRPQPLATEYLHLVGSPRLGTGIADIALSAVAALPLLLPAMGSIRAKVDAAFASQSMVPKAVMEVDSQEALLDLLREGEGYSIMSYAGVYRYVQRGEFVARCITDPCIERQSWVVTPNNRPRTLLMGVAEREILTLATECQADARWRLA